MKKYLITITETRLYEIETEAKNKEDAFDIAECVEVKDEDYSQSVWEVFSVEKVK